ncbi:histidine kinase [Microbispora sp. NBRC 16548]|uniref:sensor histidine kinase n=1 Tax=Microbispora sp. NBRC 16548 TaxID=3030994 RepID=UPI00160E35CA|nr:histidine kinase [Microbispora sp. NBRC 16548]
MWRDRVRGRPADAALALALVVVGQVEVRYGSVGYLGSAPYAVSAVLAALIPLPLIWRRRAPLTVLVLVGLAMALPTLVVDRSIPFWGGPMTLDVAVYSASRHAAPPRDRWALLVPAVTVGLVATALPVFRSLNEVAFSTGVFGVGWAGGQVMRSWQRRHELLGDDLLTLAESAALREQAAAAAERARIARELHDVVAHSVSVMVVQAGSARLRLRRDPAAAEEALRVVEESGREALGELRQLLGVLRADDEATAVDPQPGLAGIDDLLAQLRASGLDVLLEVHGVRRDLPPGLDLSAYRIVQEALTNALKHAGPTTATVRIGYGQGRLDLQVCNADGRRPVLARAGAGHGLVGMRERVALFGGRLEAGPRAGGGYLVRATLPLPEPAA